MQRQLKTRGHRSWSLNYFFFKLLNQKKLLTFWFDFSPDSLILNLSTDSTRACSSVGLGTFSTFSVADIIILDVLLDVGGSERKQKSEFVFCLSGKMKGSWKFWNIFMHYIFIGMNLWVFSFLVFILIFKFFFTKFAPKTIYFRKRFIFIISRTFHFTYLNGKFVFLQK